MTWTTSKEWEHEAGIRQTVRQKYARKQLTCIGLTLALLSASLGIFLIKNSKWEGAVLGATIAITLWVIPSRYKDLAEYRRLNSKHLPFP